jgi:hypothetical protein
MPVLSPDGVVPATPRPGIMARLLEWRLPPIETYPAVVAFTRTHAGKLVLFGAFAALMKAHARGMAIAADWMWLWLTTAAAAISLAGRYRYLALLIVTGALLVHAPDWFPFQHVRLIADQEGLYGAIDPWRLRAGTLIACVPLAAIALYLARRYRDHPLGRRPVLAQHMLLFGLLALAVSGLLHGLPQVLLWSVTVVFATYFWYLAYALLDQRRRLPAPTLFHFATFNTFSWASFVPMGKGAANWQSVEAATPDALAVTQLKALKLLAWALVLKGVLWAYRTVIYQHLGIPYLGFVFAKFLHGGDVRPLAGALSIIANFPEQLLIVAIWGHVFVAIARLAGFRLLRNTCRPLSSRSIAEFWNRYYYYFKELLVDVYFYPTYVRWFKRHPRLRLAFATFMAAGVGNFFFHCIFENHKTIAVYGLLEALARSQSYAFYCLLLVIGIVASQLRVRRGNASAGWFRGRLMPSLGVSAFFCLLSFFDGPQRDVPLARHFEFLVQVFGLTQWINR